MKPAQEFPTKQRITIVGTGQVSFLAAGLLIKKNRELNRQIQSLIKGGESGFENKVAELESKKIEISILGRSEDSVSFQEFKKNGFTLHFANEVDSKLDDIRIFPEDFAKITTNPNEIGEQDHVLVATKTYSHNEELIARINFLKKINPSPGLETTVIWAQNGIPCWFESKDPDAPYLNTDMFRSIGVENIVGCVIDCSCNNKVTDEGIVCSANTPLCNIRFPVGKPDNKLTQAVRNLHLVFSETGIKTAVRDHGIKQDVMYNLQIDVATNALTTLLDINIGGLLEDELCKKSARKLSVEISQLSKKIFGFELRDFDGIEKKLGLAKEHITTTKKDFDEGNKVDIFIYEDVIQFEKRLNKRKVLLITSNIADILKKAISVRDQLKDAKKALKEVSKESNDLVQLVEMSYNPGTPKRGSSKKSPTSSGLVLLTKDRELSGLISPNLSETHSLKNEVLTTGVE
ncbi:MAG: ketopantoate reductase [Rickettsiales bacterium]|jgi:ketopantoate reductase